MVNETINQTLTGNIIESIKGANFKIIYGVVLAVLIIVFVIYIYMKGASSERYFKKAERLHEEAIEFHQDNDEETAEELNEKAEEFRQKARELEYDLREEKNE